MEIVEAQIKTTRVQISLPKSHIHPNNEKTKYKKGHACSQSHCHLRVGTKKKAHVIKKGHLLYDINKKNALQWQKLIKSEVCRNSNF